MLAILITHQFMISPIFVITVFCHITVSSSLVVVVVFWSIMIVATFGFHLVHYPCSSGSRIGDVLTSLERSDEGVPNVLATATDGSEISPQIGKDIAAIVPTNVETDFRYDRSSRSRMFLGHIEFS